MLVDDGIPEDLLGIDALFHGAGLKAPPKKRKKKYEDLPPEQQKSLVDQALNVGQGGLQLLGSALDTLNMPGDYIRGLASGAPGERKTGREVLESWGVVGPNTDQGWVPDIGDVAGFAADIATDPLTYLTLGASAVGKSGKVAKAAGLSVKGANKSKTIREIAKTADREVLKDLHYAAKQQGVKLSDIADDQLGGLFGLTVPFTGISHVPDIATSKAAQTISGLPSKAVDVAAETIGKISPTALEGLRWGGRVRDAVFDPDVRGFVDPLKQELARAASQGSRRASRDALTDAMGHIHAAQDVSQEISGLYGDKAAAVLDPALQLAAEQRSGVGVLNEVGAGINPADLDMPLVNAKIGKLGEKIVGSQDRVFNELRETGAPVHEMMKLMDSAHVFRQTTKEASDGLFSSLNLSTKADALLARVPETQRFTAHAVDKMLHDADLLYFSTGTGNLNKADEITARLWAKPEYKAAIDKAAVALGKPPAEVAHGLGAFIAKKGDKFYKSGKPYYSTDILGNHASYMEQIHQAKNNALAGHDFLNAKSVQNVGANYPMGGIPPGMMTIPEAFQKMGWDVNEATKTFAKRHGQQALNGMVPEEAVGAFKSFWDKGSKQEWLEPIRKLIDPITQFYKKSLTLPFPSFHARNLVSGHWMNLASNEINSAKDLKTYWNAWQTAKNAVRNPAAHRELIDEMIIHKALSLDMKTQDVDVMTRKSKLPMPEKTYAAEPFKGGPIIGSLGVIPETVNQYRAGVAAGGSKAGSAFTAPFKAIYGHGGEMAKQIEYSNRATMYVYLREKGWSPAAAAAEVNELQIDYSDLTKFEKNVMKRVVPFYTYMRKSVPQVLKRIYERPGGLSAQTVNLSNVGRDDRESLPAYISEGMSVGLPGGGYLSEFGLPTDQLSDLFARGPTALGTVRRTGQKLGSQLHPLIKAPLEAITGVNMFTGRPITDLYQYPTDFTLANFVVGASPGARVASAIRTGSDERKNLVEKGLNLTTGLRITHPSGGLEQQRNYAAQQMMREILKEEGVGAFESVYLRKDRDYPEHVIDMYRALRGLSNEQRALKKAKEKTTIAPDRP